MDICNQVKSDDIMDALVLAVMAYLSKGKLTSIAKPVPNDEKSIPMTMWIGKNN